MENEGYESAGNAALSAHMGLGVKDEFDKVFEVEVECWCYGFAKFTGDLNGELVHRVIHEMMPAFKGALNHNYVFDLLKTARRIQNSTRCVIEEKEIAFSILVNLPPPFELDEEAQFVLGQIIDQAERAYGDVHERMERRWIKSRSKKVRAN